jgi:hypothetical protein
VALATPTKQQNCDKARVTAWAKYVSCVDAVVAKEYGGASVDLFAGFAKCRHGYFKNWTTFQSKASLTGSTCKLGLDNRFTEDVADGVVTDNLTGLVWELKDDRDGVTDFTNPHDADNSYAWSTGSNKEDGTAFTSFLGTVNGGAGFAGANGWRLPTMVELQTIMLDFACTGAGGTAKCRCPSSPCVDPALDATNTGADHYWSATSYVPYASNAWDVSFGGGDVFHTSSETNAFYVRAVRGGL